ncbi:MAG: M15 family metallopeptidase [Xanthobacteraceae bacterium]|nr:M15 family metallopeptidase [Xanthobacteraceae bacterium]
MRAIIVALALAAGPTQAEGTLPDNLVYLRDVDPTIVQDIRYASSNNFVGRPLDGYEAAECILRRDVATALAQVQKDLVASGLGLKVYDCYRPTRAVRTMALWANDGRPGGATKRFYPKLQKSTLFGSGYIASRSAHSSGTAIDLTLVDRPAAQVAPFDPAASYAACTGPVEARSPDNSLDMGTGYDCFDATSSTWSGGISAEQHRRRVDLVSAMRRRGFSNYHREWWHFTFGAPSAYYDVPIRARR